MRIKYFLIFFTVAVLATGAGYWYASREAPPRTAPAGGAPAEKVTQLSDFELPDLAGKPRRIMEWRGKLLLINFWATWCPPCREEIPLFIDFQERYAGRGFQVVGVAIDSLQDVMDYRDTLLINYPILIGEEKVMRLMQRYGNRVGTLPYSLLVAPDGRILHRKMGAYTRPELEKLLDPWLKPGK